MAQNHVQEGKVMPWTNGTGSAVASGDVVLIGTKIGVALGDIANGAVGSVAVDEVYEIAKAAPLVLAQGAAVYWDAADENVNATESGNTYGGYAFEAAASADTTVKIKLNG